MRPSLKLFFEWLKQTLCRVQVYLREETLQPAQAAQTKMPRNEAKIYQETDFLSTEGHLLTSSGCFLTLYSSLDVVQVRFTFVAFVCELSNVSNLQALFFRKRRIVAPFVFKLRHGRFLKGRLLGSHYAFSFIVLSEF